MINKLPFNNKVKDLIFTILFYLINFSIGGILDKVSPSDMCNPGLGLLFYILIFPVLRPLQN